MRQSAVLVDFPIGARLSNPGKLAAMGNEIGGGAACCKARSAPAQTRIMARAGEGVGQGSPTLMPDTTAGTLHGNDHPQILTGAGRDWWRQGERLQAKRCWCFQDVGGGCVYVCVCDAAGQHFWLARGVQLAAASRGWPWYSTTVICNGKAHGGWRAKDAHMKQQAARNCE